MKALLTSLIICKHLTLISLELKAVHSKAFLLVSAPRTAAPVRLKEIQLENTLKGITSQTDYYLVSLSSKTYVLKTK